MLSTPRSYRSNPSPALDSRIPLKYNTDMKTTTKPRMTRSHYNFLASFINDYAQDRMMSPTDHIILAGRLQSALKGTNPNFDSEKFYCAATKDLARDPQEPQEVV